MAPAPDGAVRTKRSTSANFTALLRSFAVRSMLVNIFLPKVEPLHSILMVAALVLCAALLISHLCYTLSRDDKNKK